MWFFDKIFKRNNSFPNIESSQFYDLFNNQVKSGVKVTEFSSLQASAVFACVRILAETVASLPLITYKYINQGKQRAFEHPVYQLLHNRPNLEISAYTLLNVIMAHLNLWGESFCYIEFNEAGYPIEIWPLLPYKMNIQRDQMTKNLMYIYTLPTDRNIILQSWQILNFKMFTLDGIRGISPIKMAKETIGLSLAHGEFAARFYSNGANLGGFFKHPGKLSDQAYNRLKSDLRDKYTGLSKAHKIAILEEGLDFVRIGIPPEEAQFIESRKFQRNEIASIFRVPPHLIGDLERATFSNIEQQSLEFIIYSIRPFLINIEQEINYKLFTPQERKKYFVEFLIDAILRADTESRYRSYQIGRLNGWLSVNDIRQKENMNPIEGGDEYLSPLNMIPLQFLQDYYQKKLNENGKGGNNAI